MSATLKQANRDRRPADERFGSTAEEIPSAAATSRASDKFILRLPDGMREHLAKVAKRCGRSMNAEVIAALTVYFAKEDAAKQSELLRFETAIRELAGNQQQTLELLKKMIQSPIDPKK